MDIPDGAKAPQDRQAAYVKPETHSDGWDLLRPPIDLEFWEVTDFMALVGTIPVRGDKIKLEGAGLKAFGQVVKALQETHAVSSTAFRDWMKSLGGFSERADSLLPLIFEYANALGEALSSES